MKPTVSVLFESSQHLRPNELSGQLVKAAKAKEAMQATEGP